VTDWLSNVGAWIEHHPGAAAWVQALGATLAVATAVLMPALQARHARQQRDADRRLRAKSLAIAIYPELLHIRAAHHHIQRRLRESVAATQRSDDPATAERTGADLADQSKRLAIPVTDALRAMIPNIYLLGDPMGPQVQLCIGRSMKYNDVLATLAGTSARVRPAQLLAFIEHGLILVNACIAGMEQTWGLSPEPGDALEYHVTAAAEPTAALERETASKETV